VVVTAWAWLGTTELMGTRLFRGIGTRLALAFVGVVLAAEGVFGLVIVLTEGSDVARLAAAQRAETTSAIVSALQNAFRANGGWTGADLRPAVALAGSSRSFLLVSSPEGATLLRVGVAAPPGQRAGSTVEVDRPVSVGGRTVARLRLKFFSGGLTPADRSLRSSLARSVALSAVLAAAGALAVAVAAARSLVRPIRRLSAVVQALGSGASGARVPDPKGPTELADLERAFNSMASSLERHEELRQAMVADLAHELRTPVAVLQAETEALVDGISKPTPEALVSLHDESLRLGRLVEDLQTLASAQAASVHMERSLVDLAEVAADAAGSLQSRFSMNGLSLSQDLWPAVVYGDAGRLRQVVTNLLDNAAKFTPAGGRAHVSVRAGAAHAHLEVSDSGPGIPTEERERVFHRFFRGSAGKEVGGSGIGLAVVKDLVEAHGGEVHVEAALGGGACFVVRLPLAAEQQPEP